MASPIQTKSLSNPHFKSESPKPISKVKNMAEKIIASIKNFFSEANIISKRLFKTLDLADGIFLSAVGVCLVSALIFSALGVPGVGLLLFIGTTVLAGEFAKKSKELMAIIKERQIEKAAITKN